MALGLALLAVDLGLETSLQASPAAPVRGLAAAAPAPSQSPENAPVPTKRKPRKKRKHTPPPAHKAPPKAPASTDGK